MIRPDKEVIHKLQNKFIGHLRDVAKSGSQMLEVFAKISCKLHTYINQEQVSIQYTPKFRLPSTTMQWGSIYQHLPGNKGIVRKRNFFSIDLSWISNHDSKWYILVSWRTFFVTYKSQFCEHQSHASGGKKMWLHCVNMFYVELCESKH